MREEEFSQNDQHLARSGRIHRYLAVAHAAGYRLLTKVQNASLAMYIGVAALVGADLFAMLVVSIAIWPIGIPILIAVLGSVYYTQRALRRRRQSDTTTVETDGDPQHL